jgi:hypothetical protein
MTTARRTRTGVRATVIELAGICGAATGDEDIAFILSQAPKAARLKLRADHRAICGCVPNDAMPDGYEQPRRCRPRSPPEQESL